MAVINIQTGFQDERLTLTFIYLLNCANFHVKFG